MGTYVDWPEPLRYHDCSSPLASCWMASIEGMRPLNMTSFRWPHMDQSMEKSRCHSAENRCVPSPKDLQKASQDEISSRSTLARCHTDKETGQVMKRCSNERRNLMKFFFPINFHFLFNYFCLSICFSFAKPRCIYCPIHMCTCVCTHTHMYVCIYLY